MTSRASIALLIAANLVPVFGVLYWDWDVFALLFLFWCENVVIGLFGIARTAVFSGRLHKMAGIFLSVFFLFHYGGFMTAHLMLLLSFFGGSPDSFETLPAVIDGWTLLAICALFVSHGWSFVENFLGNREYEMLNAVGAMAMPYKRMMVTHVALIAGGFFLMWRGEPLFGLLLLLAMKIALDVIFHRREHRSALLDSNDQ